MTNTVFQIIFLKRHPLLLKDIRGKMVVSAETVQYAPSKRAKASAKVRYAFVKKIQISNKSKQVSIFFPKPTNVF